MGVCSHFINQDEQYTQTFGYIHTSIHVKENEVGVTAQEKNQRGDTVDGTVILVSLRRIFDGPSKYAKAVCCVERIGHWTTSPNCAKSLRGRTRPDFTLNRWAIHFSNLPNGKTKNRCSGPHQHAKKIVNLMDFFFFV